MDKYRNDKSRQRQFCNASSVKSLNRIPLSVLINRSLIIIYYNNSH